jgi:membrane-associated protease RseP (regulator of RpoE activity)
VGFRGTSSSNFSHIASVEPDSLGERSGFRPGDVLVSLNGEPISSYNQGSLGALIRGTEPLRWIVERDGVEQVIEVP